MGHRLLIKENEEETWKEEEPGFRAAWDSKKWGLEQSEDLWNKKRE